MFQNTPKYIGPSNIGKNIAFAGNNLTCNNCHLGSGTKPFAAPLIGIKQRFPQFRGRENKISSIEERINGCMERSMNGEGLKSIDGSGYLYPPLWGDDSYNNGAGMTRVITAAQFIKANMPFGTTYDSPVLTDKEAYDVAGYINQQIRPNKINRDSDFPDLKKKPVSTPYPPYADLFSLEQHQLGPFLPIIAFYKAEFNIVKSK